MKQFIATFFLLIGLCNMATAQEGIFVNYEKMPEYPGGERKWIKDRDTYMETRLKELFPEAAPFLKVILSSPRSRLLDLA